MMGARPSSQFQHLIGQEVLTAVAPGISKQVRVIDAREYGSQHFLVVIIRDDPEPAILGVREPGQFTIPVGDAAAGSGT